MSQLAEKIRRTRQSHVEAGGHMFTVLRPTHADALRLREGGVDQIEIMARFVVGWNLTELDLVPGGSPVAAPFDAEDFREWVSDHPETWEALTGAIVNSYVAHAKGLEDAQKN